MAKALRTARRYWKLIAVSCFSLSIAMALGVLALSVSNTVLLLPPSGAEPDRLVMIYSHSANVLFSTVLHDGRRGDINARITNMTTFERGRRRAAD